jgi:hypothetical protein
MADGRFGLSGASFIELEGSADDVIIDASGASNVKFGGLSVGDASIDLSGASGATVNAGGSLDVNLSGASRLSYLGSPTLGNISVTGGSTISRK